MKAAVLRALGRPLEIEALTMPSLGTGHVLVRMQCAAVCHSQKLEVTGGRGEDRYLPHLIGHEGVGLVEDIGPGVTKVRRGDQVVLSWIRGSGRAADPIVYGSARGPVNAGPIATFCETPIVAEACVTRVDPPIDPAAASLAGCAIPTGAGTVWNAMLPDPGGSVCIIGAGGVGLSAIAGAAYAGWRAIIAVDLRPARLARARQIGATHTINASALDVEEAVRAATGGRGADLVVECAGSARSMESAIRVAKPKGGRVLIAGNLQAGKTIQVDPFDLIRGRWLGGSWGGNIDPDVDIPKIVALIRSGALPTARLTGPHFSLASVNEAIRALDDDEPGRPIIDFAGRIRVSRARRAQAARV